MKRRLLRGAALVAALSLMTGMASATHSEVDTYYAPTGSASVVHLSGGCGGNEHTGGGCFTGFDVSDEFEDEISIQIDDAVTPQIGTNIVFRPATGADVKITLCASDGVTYGPYLVPMNTNRVVVFIGVVVDAVTQTVPCPPTAAGGLVTTGTVTATYS